jgi:hypothetical protein
MGEIQEISEEQFDIDFKLDLIYSNEDEEKIQELLKENKIRIVMDYSISEGAAVRQTSISWIPINNMES